MHFFSPSVKMLLSYAVFITVLLARPQGLFAR
jgi:branched-chain amino acid transport system permease protein